MSSADKPIEDFYSGSTEPWTADVIAAMVRALRPHELIETGTYLGFTTVKLLDAMSSYSSLHGSFLFSIDVDQARSEQAQEYIFNAPRPVGSRAEFGLLVCDALAFLQTRPDSSSDFIFLDDDHTADHVADEIREAMRVLRPGGVCVVHDVIGPFNLSPVIRAFGGICLPFERLHVAGGLGVIVR